MFCIWCEHRTAKAVNLSDFYHDDNLVVAKFPSAESAQKLCDILNQPGYSGTNAFVYKPVKLVFDV